MPTKRNPLNLNALQLKTLTLLQELARRQCGGLSGGALAVGLLGLRSVYVRPFMPGRPAWFARLAEPGENVPYGVAIAVGAMTAFPASALVAHL